jgi:kexin
MNRRRTAFLLSAMTAALLAACGGSDSGGGREVVRSTTLGALSPSAGAGRALESRNTTPTPNVFAPTTYDPAMPDRVTVGTIVVGDTRYNDVVATFGGLAGIGNGTPTRTYDSYDAGTGQLTVASVTVGGTTYTDVVVNITGVLSIGSSGPLAAVIPNDPLFRDQWHLQNTGQAGPNGVSGATGEDLRVLMAWNFATGTGVRIAVVDDGLDINHEDLNVVAGRSWDYRVNAYGDPSSDSSSHGTACGGLAAARGNNANGVTGVAFGARLVGYNLLAAQTGDFGADAVIKDLADNHVYTNSYGADDNTGTYAASDQAWRDAIDTGTRNGRGGKGAIYTWAAGNGAPTDRSDYDGSANYAGVLAIGALNDQGRRASYSEPGANLLVMAYGGEECAAHQTTTVDVTGPGGYNNGATSNDPNEPYSDYVGNPNYTRCFNGTSAATPQAAGAIALMLEANPNLGWRDVRAILATTARKNDPNDSDWVNNGAGLSVNHNYGFGTVDAAAAVNAARVWQNLPAQITANVASTPQSSLPIPDAGAAVVSTLALANSGISRVEFVEFVVDSDHADVGELEITLTSPSGTASTVSTPRQCQTKGQDGSFTPAPCGNSLAGGFRFGIARLLREPADGTWTMSIRDHRAGNAGSLVAWSVRIHGH